MINYNVNDNNILDSHIFNFIKMLGNKENNVQDAPHPTTLRVSTRSATCKLTKAIYIEKFAHILKKNIENNIVYKNNEDYPILGISMKGIELNTYANNKKRKKKINNINDIIKTNSKNKSNFFNQCTVIVRPNLNTRPVNIKLFLNGSSSMTGCLNENDGLDAMYVLLKELKKYSECFYNDYDIDNIEIIDYKISMINSDYSLEFKVDRLVLYNLLISITNLLVTYEPERYPGVKISYYHNNNNNNGVCKCSKLTKCNGKGLNLSCKKITIAIFQSGNVIITGARTEEQASDAYTYINKIMNEHYIKIVKLSILDNLDKIKIESDGNSNSNSNSNSNKNTFTKNTIKENSNKDDDNIENSKLLTQQKLKVKIKIKKFT